MKKTSILSAVTFVVRLYIKATPIRVLWDCLLNAVKNIMTVVTSVWLLKYLMKLILEEASFADALIPLGIVFFANLIVDTIQKYYNNCIKPQSDLKLRTQFEKIMLNHAKNLPLKYFENSEFYTTVEQSQEGVSAFFLVYNNIINIFAYIVAIFSAVKVSVEIDPFLLLFVVFTIPMIAISKKIGKLSATKKMNMAQYDKKKKYAKSVWLTKSFVREFKTSNASKIPDKHYEDAYTGALDTHLLFGKKLFGSTLLGSCFSITSISILSYLYCIIRFAYSDVFDIASVSVILVAVMNMVSKVRKIYQSYEDVCRYQVQLSALKKFLEYEPENENEAENIPGEFESMEFCNVWFSYDKKNWVLKDVSFKIKVGEKISIVGYNGAGKSTLIKLVLRFYDVDRGKILYNGVNIKEYKLKEYRKKFFAVFQDFQIYSIELAENILMSKYSSTQKADIDHTLNDLNMQELIGKETCLLGREYDKNGLVLSGGQQQKISVSRLKYNSFEIAILDEPSAALDPISSQKMLNSIMSHTKNRTVLLVSHDMSFSKSANKVLFFENGELREAGSHNDLIRKKTKYALFYKCQAEAFKNEK